MMKICFMKVIACFTLISNLRYNTIFYRNNAVISFKSKYYP